MSSGWGAGGSTFLWTIPPLLIGLKLSGNLDWSWWWVLAPIWVPVVLYFIGLGLYALAEIMEKKKKK